LVSWASFGAGWLAYEILAPMGFALMGSTGEFFEGKEEKGVSQALVL